MSDAELVFVLKISMISWFVGAAIGALLAPTKSERVIGAMAGFNAALAVSLLLVFFADLMT